MYQNYEFTPSNWKRLNKVRKEEGKGAGFMRTLMKNIRIGRKWEASRRIAEGLYG